MAPHLPLPPGFEDIQRDALSRLFGRMVGLRLFALPLAVALALFVAVSEPAFWRSLLVASLVLSAFAFFVAEALRHRQAGLTPRAVPLNLVAVLLIQLLLAFATGALESPVTYAFVPLATMVGIFATPRAHLGIVAVQIGGVMALLAVELCGLVPDLNPSAFGGGARAGHSDVHLVTTAVVLSVLMALASRAGRGVRRAFDAMLSRALSAQEESLRAHAERTEELTALSAEIAHELKNPLASVKGLSALLAEQVPSGKAAERLAVLRREVDRMQGILGEFLNFSRPLVPLEAGRVDLARLALEVGQLHEGMAHERAVRLEVRATPAVARCDARKVKQVLMNLVQNALDASPGGAAVEVEVHSADGEVTVRVLDRGSGIEKALLDRAFEAGVTTKPRGSGLGLTIARALARQHGGEVELKARPGGGCEADLRLPAACAAAEVAP